MNINTRELWYQIQLEAYCVRGTVDSNVINNSTKALVLAGTARKLRELADKVDAVAERCKDNSDGTPQQ